MKEEREELRRLAAVSLELHLRGERPADPSCPSCSPALAVPALLDELDAKDAELATAHQRIEEAERRLSAASSLHQPLNDNIDSPCDTCRNMVWPCPTARIVDALAGGGS